MNETAVVGYLLAGTGTACVVVGAYLTGASGGVHPLLVVGLGATGTWVALGDQLHADDGSADAAGEDST